MKTFNSGQQLLQRQRFSFPSDWLYYDMLEGEWSAFNEILTRKSDSLGSQIPLLQRKIIEEEKVIDQKIKDLASDWNQNKPLGGNIKYTTALDTLKMFEGRISKLKTEYERLIKVTLSIMWVMNIRLKKRLNLIVELEQTNLNLLKKKFKILLLYGMS